MDINQTIKGRNLIFLLPLIGISFLFIKFIFHDIHAGTDELRTTFVAKEIAERGNVYFTDQNNSTYGTNIFIKTGFLINENKTIYPFGFTINSIILVPLLSLTKDSVFAFNLFALTCFILSYLTIYQIFIKLKIKVSVSIIGSVIFSITNYNLAMYVNYYPDFLLSLLFLILINTVVGFEVTKKRSYFFILPILSSFLLSYKITMYPILFTFFILYLPFLRKFKQVKFSSIFVFIFVLIISLFIFNIPQLSTSIIGKPYGDLVGGNNQLTENTEIVTFSYKVNQLTSKFFSEYLFPKENGKWLMWHLKNDFIFFSSNNIIVLFGLLISTVYLSRKNKPLFIVVTLLFATSFILWGNMNFYGGDVPDLTNLRNTHTRYMLPIITLFYILGFFYLSKIIKNHYLLMILLVCIFIRTCISITNQYPFLQYSLINKTSFINSYRDEKKFIFNLNIPKNSFFVSATVDDYDLSYHFDNYANLRTSSDNLNEIETVLNRLINNKEGKSVYLLIPKLPGRFDPIKKEELDTLNKYIGVTFSKKILMDNRYRQLFLLSKK